MHATPEATERFADDADLAEVGYTTLGRTGLRISRLGFGTYRVDDRSEAHKEALAAALRQGVNLIDTAGNYGDGHAERAVGEVLAKLIGEGAIARDQVVVVSKLGLVQGSLQRTARELEAEETPVAGMVHFQDAVWQCIHPDWLEGRLGEALERLRLDAIDLVLLHNPEVFLADAQAHRKDVPLEKVREQLYGRIERAFEWLERACDAGRIRWYGVSSNTLASPVEDPQSVQLGRLIEAARAAAARVRGDADAHRFAAIETPLNLYEHRAATASLGKEGTLLEQARKAGLAVLTNRPLNAILGSNRLLRLADPPQVEAGPPLDEAAAEVKAIEAVFVQDFAPKINVQGGPPATQIFRWGDELANAPARLTGVEHWMAMQSQVIAPQIQTVLQQLSRGFRNDPAFNVWAKRYVEAINVLLASVSAALVEKLRGEAKNLAGRLAPHVPASWQGASFARQAIGTLLSTEGVTCVLVGMRRTAWVEDALGAVGLEKLPPGSVRKVYEAFAR